MFTDHRFAATHARRAAAGRRRAAPRRHPLGRDARDRARRDTAPSTACRFPRWRRPATRRPSSTPASRRAPTTSRSSTTTARRTGCKIPTIDRDRAWRGDRRREEAGQARGRPHRLRARAPTTRSPPERAGSCTSSPTRRPMPAFVGSRRGRAGVRDAHAVGHREHDGRRQRRVAPQGCAPRAVHHRAPERTSLEGRFPSRPGSKQNLAFALAATKRLFDAGVPILAGTDAPNPGTSHGVEPSPRARAAGPGGALARKPPSRRRRPCPARIYSLRDRGPRSRPDCAPTSCW